jgi:CO/xanthine dehydrogenase Mo-binding subunit
MSRRVTLKLGFQGHVRDVTVTIPDDEPTPWQWSDRLAVVGKPAARLDGPAKTTGAARYTYDVELAGMLYGAILRSPYPHARIRGVDLTHAARLSGVRAVLRMDDNIVRFAGQEVAAVAAVTPDIANDALRLIGVEYEQLPFVADLDSAMASGAPAVFERRPNVEAPAVISRGDPARGFAQAAVIHEAVYRTPVQTHVSLEVHGAVASWNGEMLTVWTSTQGIFTVRDDLAVHFSLPHQNVHVISDYLGGGFGSKFGAGPEVIIAARLAKMAAAPVKVMLTRQAEHLATGNRPNSIQKVRLGVDQAGTLTAIDLVQHGSGGIGGGSGSAAPFLEIYRCPNIRTEESNVFMNTGPASPMRAPGWPQGCFALELAMDETARKLKIDRLELRRRNNDNPVRELEFTLGAKAFGWERRSRAKKAAGPIRRGIGVASAAWHAAGRPGPEALVIARRDGSVEVRVGTQDIGTGTRTILAMVAAEELGLGLERVSCAAGDTRLPYSVPSGGSQTAPSNTPAVRQAAARLKRKLFAIAAPMLGVKARDLVARDATVQVRSDPSRRVAFDDVCKRIAGDSISGHGERVPNYGGLREAEAGCQFAEVEVDVETGIARVTEVVAVHDAGRILDPLTARSQVHGGVLMGVGFALLEQRRIDPALGLMVNPTMDDYKLVGPMDVPEIKTLFVEVANGINNTGVLGFGEVVHVATAAAIACAVYDAIGVPVRELPLTPDRVLAAMETRA